MSDLIISGVQDGSIAQEAGIEPGDRLIAINGQSVRDVFDYRFLSADEQVLLEVMRPDGELLQIEVQKEEWEDLGLCFDKPLMDEERSCRNKCIFCFIDQLPEGMRPSLYYKDDDARLSFLYGNYITMTNMDSNDLERIVRYRMSPVNVSVHTTNPELRIRMLNNRFAGEILSKLKYLADNAIRINAQIVLCRGINDGKELDRTLTDLAELLPALNSISVVPVGLTRYRSKLPVLMSFDREAALGVIEQVGRWQRFFLKKTGSAKVFLADEWYLMSGTDLPEYDHYEDFPQIENGVGMAAQFQWEFNDALKKSRKRPVARTVSLVTGMLAENLLTEAARRAEKAFPGLTVLVHPIKNNFFGNTVTVTGLLTGKDILEQLSGKPLGDVLFMPSNMFRAGTEILLDDITADQIGQALRIPAKKVNADGTSFLKALLKQ